MWERLYRVDHWLFPLVMLSAIACLAGMAGSLYFRSEIGAKSYGHVEQMCADYPSVRRMVAVYLKDGQITLREYDKIMDAASGCRQLKAKSALAEVVVSKGDE